MFKILIVALTLGLLTQGNKEDYSNYSCSTVRLYVKSYGVEAVKGMARRLGYTKEQIESVLRKCIDGYR